MAALLLAACGTAGTGSGPSPGVTPGQGFDLVVSDHDTTATMQVGQKVELVLHARGGMSNWMQPRSSKESVLAPIVDPAATAVRGVTLAAFQAMSPGEAQITAYASPICSPGQACPMYVAVFNVTVTVTA
ncbi:MAG: hypothetical protein ABI334_08085 [Candidatus Dormiibacterota bacterium]